MAQLAVEGKNVLIEFLKDGIYVPYACAISIDFYRDKETIETSTVDSAGESEFEYSMGSWGVTLNGVSHIVPNGSTGITVFDMIQKQLNKDVADLRLTFEDSDGNLKVITGRALLPHIGISAGSEGFSEDDVELKGTGVMTVDTELIDPEINDTEVMKIEFTAVGGETTIQDDALIGKSKSEILHVHRDTIPLEPIDVGTPTDKQVKLISGTGTLSFLTELFAGEFVLILYK